MPTSPSAAEAGADPGRSRSRGCAGRRRLAPRYVIFNHEDAARAAASSTTPRARRGVLRRVPPLRSARRPPRPRARVRARRAREDARFAECVAPACVPAGHGPAARRGAPRAVGRALGELRRRRRPARARAAPSRARARIRSSAHRDPVDRTALGARVARAIDSVAALCAPIRASAPPGSPAGGPARRALPAPTATPARRRRRRRLRVRGDREVLDGRRGSCGRRRGRRRSTPRRPRPAAAVPHSLIGSRTTRSASLALAATARRRRRRRRRRSRARPPSPPTRAVGRRARGAAAASAAAAPFCELRGAVPDRLRGRSVRARDGLDRYERGAAAAPPRRRLRAASSLAGRRRARATARARAPSGVEVRPARRCRCSRARRWVLDAAAAARSSGGPTPAAADEAGASARGRRFTAANNAGDAAASAPRARARLACVAATRATRFFFRRAARVARARAWAGSLPALCAAALAPSPPPDRREPPPAGPLLRRRGRRGRRPAQRALAPPRSRTRPTTPRGARRGARQRDARARPRVCGGVSGGDFARGRRRRRPTRAREPRRRAPFLCRRACGDARRATSTRRPHARRSSMTSSRRRCCRTSRRRLAPLCCAPDDDDA